MAGTKEGRRQVIKSGSPLKHHSLNQKKVRVGNQGEIRVRARNPQVFADQSEQRETTQEEIVQSLLSENLPLGNDYLVQMLPAMVDLASERIAEEDEKQTNVPVRIFRIVSDIQKIYRSSKAKGINLTMVDREQFTVPDRADRVFLPSLSDHIRYPDLFNKLMSFNLLTRTTTNPGETYTGLYRIIISNLTSPDFSQAGSEQVKDRVKIYCAILGDIALNTETTQEMDIAFLKFLEELKAPLLKM